MKKGKIGGRLFYPLFIFLFFSCSGYKKFLHRQALIDTLDMRTKKMEKENKKALEELKADILFQLDRINNRLEELHNLIQETQEEIYKVRKRKIEETTFVPETIKEYDETKAEELYQIAYQDMIRGEYEQAIFSFENFLQKYPNSELADNAQYWISECYYALGNIEKAIIELEKVITNYPKGNKVPASMYKLGLIYLNKKNKNKAKEYFQKLIKEYPNTNEAKLAKEKLKEL
ncbi:MAG: tol-pal system protein YbgF [candidate division WOR-3 bacterium]|nr:tol-pal system protein YbgF [candidate division WOR-3 bacterium]MCX7836947.1 tol-pal system protein YbgF [candidate division WOR-3 bacterium]MDW8114149.1 tol-pal system protein YbgF [candidate division WOR-3 bacterium]